MLGFFARHGRWVLLLSLVVGLVSTTANGLVRPWLGLLIALLLFVACLRVGLEGFGRNWRGLKPDLIAIGLLQMALPLCVGLIANWLDFSATTTLIAVLLTAAPALSGSPHLVTLLGYEPSSALRMMILSTALVPVTVFPVLLAMPQIGGFSAVLVAAVKLASIIFIAAFSAFFIRARFWKTLSQADYQRIDGVATILLAVTVVGLMSAVQPLLLSNPLGLLTVFLAACGVNFGLQVIVSALAKKIGPRENVVHLGVIGGNRNIALFLTALPAATLDPVLAFIGCYQVPMYLTPLVMRGYYRSLGVKDARVDQSK